MHLATGQGQAHWNGSHVVLTVPSGSETIEIAIPINQAGPLSASIGRAAREGIGERVTASAAVLPFKRAKRRKG